MVHTVRSVTSSTLLNWPLLFQCRVPEDCDCDRHWVRHHGIHRLLRQTHSHPHQQHYRRSLDVWRNWTLTLLPRAMVSRDVPMAKSLHLSQPRRTNDHSFFTSSLVNFPYLWMGGREQRLLSSPGRGLLAAPMYDNHVFPRRFHLKYGVRFAERKIYPFVQEQLLPNLS